MKHIHVAAAVLIDQGKVFAAKRNNTGELACKWEFPGGKLEPGETGEAAIIREIKEDLSVTITVDRYLMTVTHTYTSFLLTMDAYICTIQEGAIILTEHEESQWLSAESLFSVDWAAADLPIVHKVVELLSMKRF
jgi:8-oxo-dGTP diphosphatase